MPKRKTNRRQTASVSVPAGIEAIRQRLIELHNDPTKIVEAYNDVQKLKDAADYHARGQRFGSLGIDELTAKCAQFASAWTADPANHEKRHLYEDAQSEFRLRGQEPPPLTIAEIRMMQRHLQEALDDPRAHDLMKQNMEELLRNLTDPKRQN